MRIIESKDNIPELESLSSAFFQRRNEFVNLLWENYGNRHNSRLKGGVDTAGLSTYDILSIEKVSRVARGIAFS